MAKPFSKGVRIGLRGRAILIVASLIVCSVLGASVISALRTNRIIRKNQDVSIMGLASGLASAVELPIAVGDKDELDHLANQFLDLLPDAAFILIEDTLGQRQSLVVVDKAIYQKYQSGRLEGPRASIYTQPIKTSTAFRADKDLLSFSSANDDPSLDQSAELGKIIIGSSDKELHAAQREQWRSLALTIGVILSLVLPLVFVSVGSWTARLARLIENAGLISSGDYTRNLIDKKHDEIGQLAGAFESMRLAIRERIEAEQRRQGELLKARQDAETANQAKSQFLAHMSHEIRTPINGVTGMLELLSMTRTTEKQRRHIRTAISSADALLCLINDILDFSKIEAGHIELEQVPFDLHDILESAAEMLAHKAAEKEVEIICDIGRMVPRMIVGDPTRLRQVVINLISNAIKFTSTGEIVIRATTITQDDKSWMLRVAVSDTGIGIPADQRDRLFESFSQLDASTTRKFGGTGLGLAICKGFVRLMGGRIGINPNRSKGSEFWFTFKAGICDDDHIATPVFRGVLSNMRAMIVDDNETNRAIYSEALTNWGMRARACSSGKEALDELLNSSAAGNDPYELVILDMQMPEMDGAQLADAIASSTGFKTPTMVMLTSMYNTADKDDLENLSLAACLQKPVRLSTLHDALAQYMGGTQIHSLDQGSESDLTKISLKGARALVAEDNSVNQLVISELLKSFGVIAEVVPNGAEAVSCADANEYSFILMDCEMPELDGFEATRWIRIQENSRPDKPHIPIIALTANAIQGDRERCIDVGMDDYLTKPINAKKLYATLAKWYSPKEHPQESMPDEPLPQPPVNNKDEMNDRNEHDENIIDIEGAISRCGGSPRVLCLVLEEFTKVADEIESQFQKFIDDDDLKGIVTQAHSLKGAAANIGADQLSSDAKALESAAKNNDLETAIDAITTISRELGTLRAGLPSLMGKLRQEA